MKNHPIIRIILLVAFAVGLVAALASCTPAPPHKTVTVVVVDGEIVAWHPNPAEAELAAHNAGCPGDVQLDLVWTGGPRHGNTWPFKPSPIDRPVAGDKEVGLDFSVPFGVTEACR